MHHTYYWFSAKYFALYAIGSNLTKCFQLL